MKTLLLVLAILGALYSRIQAQDPSPIEMAPLPPGPPLVRAPDFARWQIAYSVNSPEASASAPKTSSQGVDISSASVPSNPAHDLTQIIVTKTGQTYHREVHYADGKDLDEWWVNGTQITQQKGNSGYVLSLGTDMFYIDYGSSDFPDMKWVDATTFVGIQTLNGAKCLVFKKQIPRAADDILASLTPDELASALKNTQEATAWVTLATRLPVQYTTASEKETYTFLSPPASPLTLPPDGAKEMAAWEKKKAVLDSPGPRP